MIITNKYLSEINSSLYVKNSRSQWMVTVVGSGCLRFLSAAITSDFTVDICFFYFVSLRIFYALAGFFVWLCFMRRNNICIMAHG